MKRGLAIVLLGRSNSDINCDTRQLPRCMCYVNRKHNVRYSLSIDLSDQGIIFVDIRLRHSSRVKDRMAYDGCPTHCIS